MGNLPTNGNKEHIGDIGQLLAARGRSSTPAPPNESKIKLAEILRIRFSSKSESPSELRIATIVPEGLFDEISKYYQVVPLLPSCLVNTVDSGQPKMIIIHRSAFNAGPWFGTEDAAGGSAVNDVRTLLPWSRKRNVPVLFVENGTVDKYYTPLLREIGTEIYPNSSYLSVLPDGSPRSRIYRIVQSFSTDRILDDKTRDVN